MITMRKRLIALAVGGYIAGIAALGSAVIYRASTSAEAHPNVTSIMFKDPEVARQFFDEAHAIGECVVLEPISDGVWLRSCTVAEIEHEGFV